MQKDTITQHAEHAVQHAWKFVLTLVPLCVITTEKAHPHRQTQAFTNDEFHHTSESTNAVPSFPMNVLRAEKNIKGGPECLREDVRNSLVLTKEVQHPKFREELKNWVTIVIHIKLQFSLFAGQNLPSLAPLAWSERRMSWWSFGRERKR